MQKTWGQATCELDHDNPYQLLVAALLSTQTTVRRVNEVTPAVFERYPNARALARADIRELEALIRATGFYRMKATHLIAAAAALVTRHDGEVPRTLGELERLPGVSRKTAHLVLGIAFGRSSGMAVDAHVQRVSRRLGLSRHARPREIERDLTALVPREYWIDVSQELNWHGRYTCHSRHPACDRCALKNFCPSAEVESP